MKYFFDTEFLEGKQERLLMLKGRLGNWMLGYPKPTIDLISIGIVAEDGREYYAISKDFNLKEAWNRWQQRTGEGDRNIQDPRLYWLRDNVLKPIWREMFLMQECDSYLLDEEEASEFKKELDSGELDELFTYKSFKRLLKIWGKSNLQISNEVKHFCTPIIADKENCKENFLVKRDTPEFYAYYADYDWVVFCWLFGKMMDLPKGFPMYCRDLKQMFDDKEDALRLPHPKQDYMDLKAHSHYPKQENEHNAIADARWNKNLYFFLKDLAI